MSIDLSDISQGLNSAAGLVLVSADQDIGILPQSNEGPSDKTGVLSVLSRLGITPDRPQGFLFHIKGEERVALSTDITDHYIENNTTLQDQAALKPERVVVQGFIGELNNVPPPDLLPLKIAADKLSFLSPFVPELSAGAIRAYNIASQTYAQAQLAKKAAQEALSIVGIGAGPNNETKQQEAYVKFYNWWSKRQLFKVQTPWAIFEDVMIETLRAVQGPEGDQITDFEITFKKIRIASALIDFRIGGGRMNSELGNIIDKGVSKPTSSIGVTETGLIA